MVGSRFAFAMGCILTNQIPSAKGHSRPASVGGGARPTRRRQGGALLLLALGLLGPAATPAEPLPITRIDSPEARLLEQWARRGTAAGNHGDFYENRDTGHSPFPTELYPQISRIPEPGQLPAPSRNRGACFFVRPQVVLGNASTASPSIDVGSNARILYTTPAGIPLLYSQYRSNNLYVYPEHRDHDPGELEDPGWGDLFPANTPYLLISQGSSHSDQPFLHAAFATLAAFQPETKRRLVAEGLLMPTLQMLLRFNLRPVAGEADRYLSGLAHPSAFRGEDLDGMAMIRQAHSISPDSIPPLARLRVLAEDLPELGTEGALERPPEHLADTPCAIARIWRSHARTRRMILSGQDSFDPNDHPLTYRWVVLRGDPDQIQFHPRNPSGSEVELTLTWSGRRPIRPGSDMASSRMDVALFVSNGTWWSAPAMVTWLTNPREQRSWDSEGRPLDIAFHATQLQLQGGPLEDLLDWLQADPPSPGAIVFRSVLEGPSLDHLLAEEPRIRALGDTKARARQDHEEALRSLDALRSATATPDERGSRALNQASNRVAKARGRLADAEAATHLATGDLAAALVQAASRAVQNPRWLAQLAESRGRLSEEAPPETVRQLDAEAGRLENLGLAPTRERWVFQPSAGRSEFTAAESELLVGLQAGFLTAWIRPPGWSARVIPRFTLVAHFPSPPWRDVFRYGPVGERLGWSRHGDGEVRTYTAEGLRILARDGQGRALQAAEPRYRRNGGILVEADTGRRYTYSYDGPQDLRGHAHPASP